MAQTGLFGSHEMNVGTMRVVSLRPKPECVKHGIKGEKVKRVLTEKIFDASIIAESARNDRPTQKGLPHALRFRASMVLPPGFLRM